MHIAVRFVLALSLVLPLSLSLTGCLPSSQKRNTEAMAPADSLSRQVAADAPVHPLRLAWVADAPEADPMAFPTSLVWLPDALGGVLGGALVVADTRSGALHVLDADGTYRRALRLDGLAYPYMAGHRGDTLVVLNRGANRLDFILDEGHADARLARSVPLDVPQVATALATDSALYVKRADEEGLAFLRLREDGREAARYALPGPYWRHIGFLRAQGDAVLSLSGFRPVVDRLRPATAALDTLTLLGFDSPQFIRSNQFLLDEVDEPPLLTSSAAVLGDSLYVVNLRTDAVRLDVYAETDGALRIGRVLTYTDPELIGAMYPTDLAVRRAADGRLRFALVLQNPGGLLSDASGRVVMLEEAGGR